MKGASDATADQPVASGRATGGVTARAVVIGFLCVAVLCVVTPYAHLYVQGSELAANHMPAGAVLVLSLLAAVLNPLIARRWPRLALARTELLLIYVMMLVAAAIPARAYLAYILTVPAGSFYYSAANEKWIDYVHPHLKPWAWTHETETVRRFFEGLQGGQRIDWLAWMPQLVTWTVFVFLLCMAWLCLSLMFRRQWTEAERLAFPLIQVPLEVAAADGGELPSIFRQKLMWVGFASVCALHGLNGLHEYIPFLPSIKLTHIVVIGDVRSLPWSSLANTKVFFYASAVGIAFFIGGEVSLSLWLFYLINRFAWLMLAVFGFYDIGLGLWSPYTPLQFFRNQETGAFYVLAAMVFLDLRRRIKAAFADSPSEADLAEVRLVRRAGVGLALATAGLLLWDRMFGMSLFFAAWSIIIYYVIGIGLSRLVATSGIFFAAWSAEWLPSDAITQVFGNVNVPPASRTAIYFQQAMFINDRRTLGMPFYTDSLRIGQAEELPLGKTLAAMVGSITFAMALSSIVGLWLFHHYGALNLREEATRHVPGWASNRLCGNLQDTTGGSLFAFGCQAGGAGMMVLLTWLHRNFIGWRLSPVGYVMGRSPALARIWLSVFIGWLANSLILRYGGLRLYRKVRPFFIGLILGEFASVALWLGVDAYAGKQGHDFFPTAWPES
jgi:hypothetical protein